MDRRAELPARELRVFLALAEDPHFGRVGERLFLSQPYVSRSLASLERRVGGRLVDRSARELTALGRTLVDELGPAYDGVLAALDQARATAATTAGTLRLGSTAAVDSLRLTQLATAYESDGRTLVIGEIVSGSPFRALRDGDADVIVWPRSGSDRDLVFGPTVETQHVMVAMRADHPLAARDAVTADDLATHGLIVPRYDGQPAGFGDGFVPTTTSDGRPIPRDETVPEMFHEATYRVARTDLLFAVVSGVERVYAHRPDLMFRSVVDSPAIDMALIWMRQREDDRIQALVASVGVDDA